ncbi:hypothetical protein BGZ91_006637 [Linnemannia elongata]|nr:hypothetical protein BGZ91_006637 [Linnemannia elongata]
MGLVHNVQDQDRDRMQLSVDDIDSERTTRSTPSALLLAQPLSLAMDGDQSQLHFLSSDPTLMPLQRLRASTPLSLEHPQDYPVFAPDRAQHQAQYNYTLSNTNNTSNNNYTNNDSAIQASINNNRIGQDIARNEHISEPTYSYQSSIFTTMGPQEPYPSDTRFALTQVLTSFQGAIIDHALDHFSSQAADTLRMGSNSTPLAGSMSTFTDDARSSTAPDHMLAPSETPSLGADESRDMSNGNLSTFPRATLPRRRYATRDYSTGSISSDDWLHHPDVVGFNTQNTTQDTSSSAAVDDTPLNSSHFVALPITTSATAETPFTAAELRLQPLLTVQLDQRETPVQREQVADSALDREAASMTADSLSSAAAEAIISSTLTDPMNVAQDSRSAELPVSIEIDSQATQLGSTLHTPLEPLREDGLDLLGSSGRRIQGFDSSILSMASRIRQARLARILRLMGERDPPMAYPDRYQWGRFAPTDTRSMVNHASISRGTSRAGSSVEENQADQNLESESRDIAEDGRSAMRHRDAASSSRAQSNSSNESYASSSSASSMTSYDALDDRDEDMDWMSGTERRRRRRTGWDDPCWNRGAVRGQGRSRVVSTGTAFEGMEYISQADNLLNENGRYRSLKSSWMTNPNGESWSDDEGDDPQRRHQGQDHEDKDPESISMRRDPPSLGMLLPHNEGSSTGGLYYIYGNVRNRYGPDSVRRRRVMSDMTVLLRREQEWERELEQYDREMAEFQMGGFFNGNNTQITREDVSVPRISMIASTPVTATTTLGSSVANTGADGRGVTSNDGLISGTAVSSDIGDGVGGGAPTLMQSGGTFGSVWQRSDADIAAESSSRLPQEFRDYEQGHSHYHAQGEMANEHDRQVPYSQRRDRSLLELHRQHLLQQTHSQQHQHQQQPQQQQHQRQQQPIPIQSITHQSAVMNRTPPLLPAQPLVNEPIAHQIRRAHNTHIMGLQRRWEMQQQQQQQQLEQTYVTRSVSGERERERFQRYPGTTFVPPLVSTSSTASSLHVAVPMSRGSRSSFRTSHETSGFQHFNLTGNGAASQSHPSSSSSSSTSQYTFSAPLPPASSSISSSSGSTLTTVPLESSSASLNTNATTSTTDSIIFSSTLDGRIGRSGISSVNRADPTIHSTEQLGTTVGPSTLPSGVMLPASRDMQSGMESSGVSGSINSTTSHLIPSSYSSSSSQTGIGSLFSASLSGRTASTIATSSSSLDPTEQQQQQSSSSSSLSSSSLQSQQFFRRTRWRGSNTLYVNYEGGTLKPEEQWRRGEEERVGR